MASFVEEHCRDALLWHYERDIAKVGCEGGFVKNMKGLDTMAAALYVRR